MWLFNVLVAGGGSTAWRGSHGQEGVQHDVVCAGDEQGVTVQCTIMVLLVPVAGGDSRAGRERHSHLGTVAGGFYMNRIRIGLGLAPAHMPRHHRCQPSKNKKLPHATAFRFTCGDLHSGSYPNPNPNPCPGTFSHTQAQSGQVTGGWWRAGRG